MKRTGNSEGISNAYVWTDELGLSTKLLGKSVGSEKLYVNLDSVPPKAYSTKYHSHTQQEEFFYILSGRGVLRLNEEKIPVGAGDFLSKPASQQIAHTFYNDGTEPLVILDIGTAEREDTCYYPDEEVYLHKSNGTRHVYKLDSALDGWSSDPNQHTE